MEKFKFLLLKVFGRKYEIDSYEYRKSIYTFYRIIKNYRRVIECVTDIKVYRISSTEVIIEIYSYHPGLLIGKGGSLIKELNKFLKSEVVKYDFKIQLKETNLFKFK